MTYIFKRILGLIIIFILLYPTLAYASESGDISSLSVKELVAKSDVIAIGYITGYESYVENDHVFTDTLVTVEYYLGKPAKHRTIRVKEYGGSTEMPGGWVMSTLNGEIGDVGDRIGLFLVKEKGKYRYLKPNGVFWLSANVKQVKRSIYGEVFLTLPKIQPQDLSLTAQIMIGIANLLVVLLLRRPLGV